MRLLSLFSGVGALDAAVEAAFGATVVAHCEADPYCRRVLARHWPEVPCFDDVRTLTAADVGAIDCICGGFPCTDLSVAGKQEGLQASRSGLWWEYLRLVRELRPGVVVIENVPPLYRKLEWRRQVEGPLVALGYQVIWTLCKASDVGAPHRRERTFALAVLPGSRVPQVPQVPRTGEHYPTPVVRDYKGLRGAGSLLRGGPPGLPDVVAWPTPRSEDSESTGAHRGVPDTLTSAVRLYPTPTCGDAKSAGNRSDTELTLTDVVVRGKGLWTTPTARDGNGAGTVPAAEGADALATQAAQWATPAASEAHQGYQRRHAGAKGTQVSLSTEILDGEGCAPTGKGASIAALNPAWVETLVGLPVGYTEAEGQPMRIDPMPPWPAGRGQPQHNWEPPRTIAPKTGKDRRKRLMALGNIVVPQQAILALSRLAAAANDQTQCAFGGAQMRML